MCTNMEKLKRVILIMAVRENWQDYQVYLILVDLNFDWKLYREKNGFIIVEN